MDIKYRLHFFNMISHTSCFASILLGKFLVSASGGNKQTYNNLRKLQLSRAKNKTLPRTHQHMIEVPILLWWDSVYTDVDETRQCGEKMCRVTNKREFKDHLDTVVSIRTILK